MTKNLEPKKPIIFIGQVLKASIQFTLLTQIKKKK